MKVDTPTLVIMMGLAFVCTLGAANAKADEQSNKEAQEIINQQMVSLQQKEAATFPCSMFSQSELEALVGNPLDKGSYAFNNVTENDRRYKTESCDWSAAQGEGNEVGLWIALRKHFDSGQVECSPGSDDRKISGIGDQAWWEYQKFFGMGTLRVCSAKAMLEVKVDLANKDEAKARNIAQTMAKKVLSLQ